MKKICVICEICVTKKRPKKNLCISVKSVGQKINITGHNVPISSDHHHQMSGHNQTSRDQYF